MKPRDAGELYEVHATDAYGRDVLVGYTNRAGGSDLVQVVERHPVWHSPVVIERDPDAHTNGGGRNGRKRK